MISTEQFIEATRSKELNRDLTANPEQLESVIAPVNESQKIVAGPGSGKTTVLVLRVLKIIFVDDVDPSSVIATTFTIKAADELKSRLLGWGEIIRQYCLDTFNLSIDMKKRIRGINFDLITAGTLDSIAQQTLLENRLPGQVPPVIIDDAIALSLMNKKGFLATGMFQPSMKNLFEEEERIVFGKVPTSDKRSEWLVNLNSRMKENMISIDQLSGYPCLKKVLGSYNTYLEDNLLMDFSTMEQAYLQFLKNPESRPYLDTIKFILVDEYQDTNLLQEAIYREIIQTTCNNGGSCLIVGDDDQSMYRFRGSRVYLFKDLESRMASTGVSFRIIFLHKNYRSTPNIVDFFNQFIKLDENLQSVRIKKPDMSAERKESINYPILCMFREDISELSRDLSDLILSVVRGNGYTFKDNEGKEWVIERSDDGTAADAVVLSSSPAEFSSNNKYRLPYLLNQYLSSRGIEVFNPRGQELQDLPHVQLLCGLTLLCIDPLNEYLTTAYEKGSGKIWVPKDVYNKIMAWRTVAQIRVDDNPLDFHGKVSLQDYVESWQQFKPLGSSKWDKDNVALVEIMYGLISWIPSMPKELEGLVYLEAVCRTADNSSFVNNFDGKIVFEYDLISDSERPNRKKRDYKGLMKSSVKNAIADVFVPIASGSVSVDEALLGDSSYDRLDIMSIHQAKGLEFPITIVDVASDFTMNHAKQRFKRFPDVKDVDVTSSTEDFLATLSPEIKIERTQVDRCFDDMFRRYYVAFSRPQDILLLVGLTPNMYEKKGKAIPNVGTGWTRDGKWIWGNGLPNLVHL